jgi:xylulokinase
VEAVCTPPAVRQRFEPHSADAEGHRARHARFGALYPVLRSSFLSLNGH